MVGADAYTEAGLLDLVKDEFDAFLECGILVRESLRLRCANCAYKKLVVVSCKRPRSVPRNDFIGQPYIQLIDFMVPAPKIELGTF